MIEMHIMKDREEWLEHRKKYIGASDAACVIGCNPWKSNVDLWEEKTGRKQSPDISDKPYVQFGIAAEPVIRELFKLTYPKYKVEYLRTIHGRTADTNLRP